MICKIKKLFEKAKKPKKMMHSVKMSGKYVFQSITVTQATFFAVAKLQIFSPIVYFLNTPSDYQKVTVHACYGLVLFTELKYSYAE